MVGNIFQSYVNFMTQLRVDFLTETKSRVNINIEMNGQ